MRKLSTLLVGAILALTSVAYAAPAMQPLKISKECSQYSGETPSFCTITRIEPRRDPGGHQGVLLWAGDRQPTLQQQHDGHCRRKGRLGGWALRHRPDGQPTARNLCVPRRQRERSPGSRRSSRPRYDEKQLWHWDGGYVLGAVK